MFGFGKRGKDPLADAKSVQRWFATLPAADPLHVNGATLGELGRIAGRNARRTPAGLEAVFALDTRTAELRRTLTTQYIEHASRSPKIENQLWSALFDLTQGFLFAYQAFGEEIATHPGATKWQQMLPELILRQIMHFGLDARVRLYRYEQWIPAKWAELHALFALACSHHIDRRPIVLDKDSAPATIEQQYLLVLMVHLVHVGNVTARHLDDIAHQLPDWCEPLRFALEASSDTSFYVDLAGREGLRRRTPAPLEGRVLFLDTRPMHSVLMQHVAVLEQKIRAEPLSDRTPKRTEHLNVLAKVAAQVDPEFKPFARRGERTAAAGTVDAIVGFRNIATFLREEERNPVTRLDMASSAAATLDLSVFGHVRNEEDRIREQARRRFAAHAAPGGPWEVKDVSQTGFRLIAPMLVANSVTLGTLAALRPHGQSAWTLGVVRRMRRLTTDRAEIGLQIIASAVLGVDLIDQRKSDESNYSVDGENTTINGRTFAGLVLAIRKRGSTSPVHSLLLPAVEYQPSRKLKLQTARSITPVRLGRLLERHPDWVWTAIEPTHPAMPLPVLAGEQAA